MGYDQRDDRDRQRRTPGQGGSADTQMAPGRTTLGHRLPFGPPRAPADSAKKTDPAADALDQVAGSPSTALPDELRGELETALGTSLGDVRVHTSTEAGAAAGALGAQAFAVGTDVYFGAGQYDPGSTAGKALIAHEVAHTVQQRGASTQVQGKLEVSTPGDAHEVEADRFAESFVAGKTSPAPVTPVAVGSVQRRVIARQAAHDAPTTPAPAPAAPAPAQPATEPDVDTIELGRQLDRASNAIESMFDHQANGATEVGDNLREVDPPSLSDEILTVAIAMALGGGSQAIAARLIGRFLPAISRALGDVVRDTIKDGIKSAGTRASTRIRGRSSGQSLGSYVAAQRDAIIDMKRAAKDRVVDVKATALRAAAGGNRDRLASDIAAATEFREVVAGLSAEATSLQYRATFTQWMSIQAQTALGPQVSAGGSTTNLGGAVGNDMMLPSVFANHSANGVIYVRCGRQSQQRPFLPRGGIRLEGSTSSARTNPAIARTPIKDLGIPIVALAAMYEAPLGAMEALRFGKNEAGTIFIEGDSYAQGILRRAAGAANATEAARIILDEDLGRLTLGDA